MVLHASVSPVALSRQRRVTPNSPRPSSLPSVYRRANSAAVVRTTAGTVASAYLRGEGDGDGEAVLVPSLLERSSRSRSVTGSTNEMRLRSFREQAKAE
jgi:hypothetical protein